KSTTARAKRASRDELMMEAARSISSNLNSLHKMDMGQLRALGDALRAICNVISGLSCQPRFSSENRYIYNEAGEVLENLNSLVNHYEDAVIKFIAAAQPTTVAEFEQRGWALLQFHACMSDSTADFAAL